MLILFSLFINITTAYVLMNAKSIPKHPYYISSSIQNPQRQIISEAINEIGGSIIYEYNPQTTRIHISETDYTGTTVSGQLNKNNEWVVKQMSIELDQNLFLTPNLLYNVVLHELGHSKGLMHSSSHIMGMSVIKDVFGNYLETERLKLNDDDIQGINYWN